MNKDREKKRRGEIKSVPRTLQSRTVSGKESDLYMKTDLEMKITSCEQFCCVSEHTHARAASRGPPAPRARRVARPVPGSQHRGAAEADTGIPRAVIAESHPNARALGGTYSPPPGPPHPR